MAVNAAKPISVRGGIYRAPLGTTLPTDASTALGAAFKTVGYISEDGVTNSSSIESGDVKCWGGVTVATLQTGMTDTFKYKVLEMQDIEVLKAIYGANNVTGTLSTGITVNVKAEEVESACWVIDMKEGDTLHRIVIGDGKITERGEIVYKDSEAIGVELTISANAFEFGTSSASNICTHREFFKTA